MVLSESVLSSIKSAVRRLARRAGVQRLSGLIYENGCGAEKVGRGRKKMQPLGSSSESTQAAPEAGAAAVEETASAAWTSVVQERGGDVPKSAPENNGKRPRGRPRKQRPDGGPEASQEAARKPARGRGRPKKCRLDSAPSAAYKVARGRSLRRVSSCSSLRTYLSLKTGRVKWLGKGRAKRRRKRKVLSDNTLGVIQPAIRRLARRGGLLRMPGLVYETDRRRRQKTRTSESGPVWTSPAGAVSETTAVEAAPGMEPTEWTVASERGEGSASSAPQNKQKRPRGRPKKRILDVAPEAAHATVTQKSRKMCRPEGASPEERGRQVNRPPPEVAPKTASASTCSSLHTYLSTVTKRGNRRKGLITGGARRHRNGLRTNISGVSRTALRRLARRGGVQRISGLIYDTTRGVQKADRNRQKTRPMKSVKSAPWLQRLLSAHETTKHASHSAPVTEIQSVPSAPGDDLACLVSDRGIPQKGSASPNSFARGPKAARRRQMVRLPEAPPESQAEPAPETTSEAAALAAQEKVSAASTAVRLPCDGHLASSAPEKGVKTASTVARERSTESGSIVSKKKRAGGGDSLEAPKLSRPLPPRGVGAVVGGHWRCSECGARFSFAGRLRVHLRQHLLDLEGEGGPTPDAAVADLPPAPCIPQSSLTTLTVLRKTNADPTGSRVIVSALADV
ncbi:uncharacterized protein LOC113202832 [Frankliniella occidentalis]|uniref:Histone H4 n=1 Tax=Frankliniella occidentalis TaxID=133901 RepID=A0A9C6TS96_FRAOC|nr:uncharacterized protein LOC113202832 [Frankliniella occidentalis]